MVDLYFNEYNTAQHALDEQENKGVSKKHYRSL